MLLQGGLRRQGGGEALTLALGEGQTPFFELHGFGHHRLGDDGEIHGVFAVLGGCFYDAASRLGGGVMSHRECGAVQVVVFLCGQGAVAGDQLPVKGTVQAAGPLVGFARDGAGGVTGGFHTVGPDHQGAVGGGRREVHVDFTGFGVVCEILTPTVGHFVFVTTFITGEDTNSLRQGVALLVHQLPRPGAVDTAEVGAIQNETLCSFLGVLAVIGVIVFSGPQGHIGDAVCAGVVVLGVEQGIFSLVHIHGLIAVVQIGDQVLIGSLGVQVFPIQLHLPGDAVQGDLQGAGSAGNRGVVAAGGAVVQVYFASQAVGDIPCAVDEAGVEVGIVLEDLPADLIQLHVCRLEILHLHNHATTGLQAGEGCNGQVKVDDLGVLLPDGYDAVGGLCAVGDFHHGLTGLQGLDMAEFVDGGHLGVAGGEGEGSIGAGVVGDAQVEAAAHIKQSGSGGEHQARRGIDRHGIGPVVSAIVAAEDVHIAGPLEVINVVFAFVGLVDVAVLGDVSGEGPFAHSGVIDVLCIEGVVAVHGVVHTGRIALGGSLHQGHHLYRGNGAVVSEFAADGGLAVLHFHRHCAVFQLGSLGVHPQRDGDHVAGHVDAVAVEFRIPQARGDFLIIHYFPAAFVIGHGEVTGAIGGDGVNALGAAGQRGAAYSTAAVVGVGEVVQGGGDGHAVVLVIIGLELHGGVVLVIYFASLGVRHLNHDHSGFPLLVQNVVIDALEEASGRDGDVFRMEYLLGIAGVGIKWVLTQIVVGISIGIAQDADAPLNLIVEDIFAIGGLVHPQGGVEDGSIRPVAVVGQEGQTDLRILLFCLRGVGEDDKALHVSTVFELGI